MIILIIGSCSQPKGIPLKGAWKWISIKYIIGDTVKWEKTEIFPDESGIKMWSNNHFVCVYRFKTDTLYDYSYSGGTFKLEGNKYEETIIYHDKINIPDMVGLKEMMLLEIRNDTLIQTYPVDENGEQLKNYTIIEKFIRLD